MDALVGSSDLMIHLDMDSGPTMGSISGIVDFGSLEHGSAWRIRNSRTQRCVTGDWISGDEFRELSGGMLDGWSTVCSPLQ